MKELQILLRDNLRDNNFKQSILERVAVLEGACGGLETRAKGAENACEHYKRQLAEIKECHHKDVVRFLNDKGLQNWEDFKKPDVISLIKEYNTSFKDEYMSLAASELKMTQDKLFEICEQFKAGLEWKKENTPIDWDNSDGDMLNEINETLKMYIKK